MAAEAVEDEGHDKPMVWVDEDNVTHYRASALGGCTTAMKIVRSGFTALAPPKSMQDRFNEGHLHEPDIVRRANTEFGLEVFARNPKTNAQWEVDVPVTPTVVITGHTDGYAIGQLMVDGFPAIEDDDYQPGEIRLFEAKTMSEQAFRRWETMSWEQRWAAYPGYAKQLTVYLVGLSLLLGMEIDGWVYAVKNKESGKVLAETGRGHPFPLSAIKAQVLSVEAHVRQGLEIPDTCHPSSQWPCPVYYMGPCGEDKRDTIDERVAEVVVELATSYQIAKERELIAKKAKERARDEIKNHLVGGSKPELPNGWKVSYSARRLKGTETVTVTDWEALAAAHPEIVEQFTNETEVEQWTSERVVVTPPKSWGEE